MLNLNLCLYAVYGVCLVAQQAESDSIFVTIFFLFSQTIDLLCSAYIQAGLGSRSGGGGGLSVGGRGGGEGEVTEGGGGGEGGGSRFVKGVIQVCVCVCVYIYIYLIQVEVAV